MTKRLISLTLLLVLIALAFLPGLAFAQPASDPLFTWGDGADGDLTIAAGTTFNIHSDHHPGRSCADGVAYEVIGLTANTATVSTSPAASCLKIGDEVALINMQGSSANTGKYELLRVKNLSANLVTFTTKKTKFYGKNAGDDSGLGGSQHVVLQRVPNYNNLTLNGNLVANSWNGTRYGLLVFKVKGNWIGSGNINLDAVGYRGGAKGNGAYQGESWPGPGVISDSPNGGGGAGRSGGNTGCPGGVGNFGGDALNQACATPAGAVYGTPDLGRIYLGSGGGGRDGGNGGRGGGTVYAMAGNINFLGTITVRGQSGENTGGGSGGSIRIEGGKVTLGTLRAIGDSATGSVKSGVGRIALYYATSKSYSSSNPAPYTEKVSTPPTSSRTPSVTNTTTPSLTPTRTPNFGATATAIALTLTAQVGPSLTPDVNATATSASLTETAQAWTKTPTPTPVLGLTLTALWLTATAQAGGTDTPTPDYNATATADALTATAEAETDTPPTPDYNATATADALTATAQAGTPDFNATGTALSLTSTAWAWTKTPTLTPSPTSTVTPSATSSPSPTATSVATATANGGGNDGGGGGGNGNGATATVTPGVPLGMSGAVCAITLNVYVYVDSNLDGMMAAQGEGVNSLQVNFLDASFGKVGSAYTSNGKATFCVPDYLRGLTLRVDIPYLQRTGTMQAPDDNNKNQPLEMWFRLEPPTLPLFIP